eukprot:3216550-Alexandrium_andersonii.AAC.1
MTAQKPSSKHHSWWLAQSSAGGNTQRSMAARNGVIPAGRLENGTTSAGQACRHDSGESGTIASCHDRREGLHPSGHG